MTTPNEPVLRHGPLRAVSERIWTVEAPLPRVAFDRRMTVVRLDDGTLLIHSAVLMDDAGMARLESLGRPSVLLVPNRYHRMDAAAYKARFPDITVLCPDGARKYVEKVVPVNGGPDTFGASDGVALIPLRGAPELVVRVTDADGTSLVFNDVLFNLPATLPGLGGLVVKLIGSTGGPKVTRIAKNFIVRDRVALASHFEELAALPDLVRAIPGHGALLEHGVSETLKLVAANLR